MYFDFSGHPDPNGIWMDGPIQKPMTTITAKNFV